ncbi:MAG: type II secretion system GspH family protein, partial [Muribaculaceae bacterium]|nr:type II secretion system GspH family protein [Muribaculaceae bacterium]
PRIDSFPRPWWERGRERGQKAAFTLAEVLITLGIIGVVAAMTIPNLIHKYSERSTITKLRVTQSILTRAFEMAEEEYGEVESWGIESFTGKNAAKVANNLKPFLKILNDCGLVDNNGLCCPNHTYTMKNGIPSMNYSKDNRYYKITLSNGVSLWWKTEPFYSPKYSIIHIFVDVNGKYLPNVYGKDLFLFAYEDKTIKPFGSKDGQNPYDKTCLAKNGSGYGCAYYVLTFQNMNYLR